MKNYPLVTYVIRLYNTDTQQSEIIGRYPSQHAAWEAYQHLKLVYPAVNLSVLPESAVSPNAPTRSG